MLNSEFLMVNVLPPSQLTIQNSLLTIKSRLAPHTATPSLDAQVLLAHLTGHPRAWLLAHPSATLTPPAVQDLEAGLQKLEAGLPLPYLLGEWEFFGLKFNITPDVLIPRPETELLVETALAWLNQKFSPQSREDDRKDREARFPNERSHPSQNLSALRGENLPEPIYVADIGTGSGCIPISLAVHRPDLRLLATDISPAALAIAHQNAQIHQVADHITFLEADLLPPTLQPSTFNLICANLPYIPTATLHTLDVYGREPTLALDGGPDGLTLIRRLLTQAVTHLAPGGLMLLEIEATQGQLASTLARHHFPDAHIQIKPDLAGYDRLLSIQASLTYLAESLNR